MVGVSIVSEKNADPTESGEAAELVQLDKAATEELASVTETVTEESAELMLVELSVVNALPDKFVKMESVLETVLPNVQDLMEP